MPHVSGRRRSKSLEALVGQDGLGEAPIVAIRRPADETPPFETLDDVRESR